MLSLYWTYKAEKFSPILINYFLFFLSSWKVFYLSFLYYLRYFYYLDFTQLNDYFFDRAYTWEKNNYNNIVTELKISYLVYDS